MDNVNAVRNRLDVVFAKALNTVISSINDSDIDECFGDLKPRNKIQNLLINKLGKLEQDFDVSCCKLHSTS